MVLVSCAGVSSPDLVADQFWLAVQAQDERGVRSHSTEASQKAVDVSNGRWRNIKVVFGEIRIKGADAKVETIVTFPDPTAESSTTFNTILRKEQDRWKVDYSETMAAAADLNPWSGITKQLEEFGSEFSKKIDDALSELQKELPELQNEVEKLGDSFLKDLEQSLEQQLPEIQKRIDTLEEALDKALEEALKKRQEREEREERNQPKEPIRTI